MYAQRWNYLNNWWDRTTLIPKPHSYKSAYMCISWFFTKNIVCGFEKDYFWVMVQLCQKLTCPLIGKWDEKNQEIQTMQGNKREIPKKKNVKMVWKSHNLLLVFKMSLICLLQTIRVFFWIIYLFYFHNNLSNVLFLWTHYGKMFLE